MEVRNLLRPENARYIPLLVLGLGKWAVGEVVYQLHGKREQEIQEQAQASIQFYSTFKQEQSND